MPGKRKEKKRLQQQNEEGLFDKHDQSEPRRITPVDIQQKEFRLAMRGYHERDVDEFLDEVTEEVARLHAENKRLREELESKVPGRFATGSATAEAEAALREAREEAARILAEAESRARTISAAASGSASAVVPAVTGAALAGFLSREKSFLQNLARMMQDHANAMKEDVRRVRETASGARTGGSSGDDSLTGMGATAVAQEAMGRQEPRTDHELWRPSEQGSAPPPQSVPSPPSAHEGPDEPPGWEESSRGEQPPPDFMGEGPHVSDLGSGSGQTPIDLRDAGRRPEAFETEAHPAHGEDVFQANARSSFETEAPSSFEPPAPPATNPHGDEPTGEWTLGEGEVDTRAAEESLVRGEAAPAPGTKGSRSAPRTEDENSEDERSMKELFWGEE
jgi:cell division initiation protein